MDIIGTSGGDNFQFNGTLQDLTITLINPYSGQEIEIDEEKNVNFDKFYGQAGFDRIELTSFGDAIFLENRDTGEQMVFDVEFVQGRAGGDIIDFSSSTIDYPQGIFMNGGSEDDILWGNVGNDVMNGLNGNDNIDGGPGDDRIDGHDDDDLIYGGTGNDDLYGDTVMPSATIIGNDTIYGGAGNDLIVGGGGNDRLFGGTGGDDSGFITLTIEEHEFTESLLFPTLIERKNIDNLAPPGTANLGVTDGNLSVSQTTTAKITFLESGAGYRNTLGFYNIAADGTIQSVGIAFENVHKSVAQPGLEYTVDLPGAPDSDFGFFIIADGFRRHGNYNNLDLDNPDNISFIYKQGTTDERLANITDNADDIDLVYNDGINSVILSGRGVYHTHARGGDGVNLNSDGAEHVVSGLVNEGDTNILRIGFEDLRNLGDADFNDVVFDLDIADTVTSEVVTEDNDIINGGAGEDLIWGGYGDDILTGGSDSDIFLFNTYDFSVDTITDFELGIGGDSLNLTDLLIGYDSNDVNDAIDDFIKLTNNGSDTIVSVNEDGQGNDFIDIAIIQNGVGGVSINELIDDGNIVVEQSIIV